MPDPRSPHRHSTPEPRRSQAVDLAAQQGRTVDRAILFADMEGYSRRVDENEAEALEFMARCFDTFRVLARRHEGQVVKTLGDGVLLLFGEAAQAILFAIEFHQIVARLQLGQSDPPRFRVGIHRGEVVLRGGDAFGQAVNIAARLQTRAAPGGTVVSHDVFAAVAQDPRFTFEPLGRPALRNIRTPVTIYGVQTADSPLHRPDPRARIRVETAGSAVLQSGDGGRVAPRGRYAAALLGYLALRPDRTEQRDRLAALLWPDRPPAAARKALGSCASRLGRALGPVAGAVWRDTPTTLGLDPVVVESDVDAMLAEIHAGRVPEVLRKGPAWPSGILSALDGLNPTFDSWLQVMRDECSRRILAALIGVLEAGDPSDDLSAAAAEAVLAMEPGNERASETRMLHAVAAGDRGVAIAEFERLSAYLQAAYGVRPGAPVQRAAQIARSPAGGGSAGGTGRADGGGRPRPPARRLLRIRVGRSPPGDGAAAHGASAFRGELIEALARFRDWSILDGDGVSGPDGGDAPRPDYRIGFATGGGQGMVLTVSLTAVRDARVIWQQRIDLARDDWDNFYRDLVRRIAIEIEVYVSADRLSAMLPEGEFDRTTHDEWLRGDRAFHRWTPDSAREAEAIFRSILARDPDHVPSLASLASLSNVQQILTPGRAAAPEQLREADALARRALEQDPLDARVQRVVAWAAARTGAYGRAAMHFDLAVDLHPNHPETLASCSMGFAWLGEREKADGLMARLQRLTRNLPEWQWCYLASVYFFLDRPEPALLAAELSADVIVDNQGWTAAIHARKGNPAAAGEAFRRLMAALGPVWAGDAPLTPQSAFEWFTGAYPIRDPADVRLLSDALRTAMEAA